MSYWQVAAGSDQRDYSSYFLRFGLAFVGGDNQIATLRGLAPNDRVILKRGLQEVVAAGIVVKQGSSHFGIDDKPWLRDFDGWDLRGLLPRPVARTAQSCSRPRAALEGYDSTSLAAHSY